MSFPRYPAYKDSGQEWIGVIPSHWSVMPLAKIASGPGSLFIDGDWVESKDLADEGIRYITTGNVGEGRYKEQGSGYISQAKFDELRCTEVLPGDVLISRLNLPIGRACVVPDLGERIITSVDNVITRPDSGYSRSFLAYMLSSASHYANMEVLARGTTMQRISRSTLGQVRFAFPPTEEQAAIASFLNHETAKIDALVAEQERLIELLKEKRQAVISHAVTKGLDPSVPMKDSGVEWLGEVPAHWEVARVKHLVQTFEQGWSPQCESFPVGSESEWGVLKVGCVNGGIFNPEENKALPPDLTPLPELGISAGDLLISRANTRELVGSAAVASADHHNLMLCDKLYRLRVDAGRCLPTFLSLFLATEQVRGQIELAATGASSSMLNISQATILELCLALPPMAEQQELLQAVDVSVAQLDQLVGEAVLSSELLRERRTALISAAVTGQIDVRGWTPPTDAP
ncbi:MAG: restriction endonuclease subunit S [Gammaproteobacteria bacterium]